MKPGLPRFAIVLIAVSVVSVALLIAGVFLGVKRARQNRQALEEVRAASAELNRDMREKIGKEDTVLGAADKAQKMQEVMGKAAAQLSGNEAKAFRAGERVAGAMRKLLAAYEASYAAFTAPGGLAPKSLTSAESIGERMTLLQGFAAANQDFTDFLKGAEGMFRAELAKESYPAAQMDETVRGFRTGANVDNLLAIRGTDADLCASMLKYLQVLKTEWGRWELNEEGKVLFQRDAAAEEFNQYGTQLQEVSKRQEELQRRQLESQQRRIDAAK